MKRSLELILAQLENLADEAQSHGLQVTCDIILEAVATISAQERGN